MRYRGRAGRRDKRRREERPAPGIRGPEQAGRIARLVDRYETYGDLDALRTLIRVYQEWLARTDDAGERADLLTDLAAALVAFARHTGDTTVFTEALRTADAAVAGTSHDDPQLSARLVQRAEILALRFEAGDGVAALTEAVGDYDRAAQLSWRRSPVDLACVARLASALCRLHEVTGSPDLLLEAVGVWRDLHRATPPDSPMANERRRKLAELADQLAGVVGRSTVDWVLGGADDPARIAAQFRVVEELAERSEVDNSAELLTERFESALALVAAVPAYHPDRALALLLLGEAELDHWQLGGEAEAAVRACVPAQHAVHVTQPGHPLRRRALTLLANAAREAALQRSAETLSATAVAAAREAMELTEERSAERALQLDLLGRVLSAAAEVMRRSELLEEAVRHHREAVALTDPESDAYPLRLTHLAAILYRVDEFDEAIRASRLAVQAIPETNPRRVGLLFNHATAVLTRAVERRETGQLVEAERIFREALSLLPAGHADHPRILSVIAHTSHQRYTIGGDLDALAEAVALARQAVAETPEDHHWWPIRAWYLAEAGADLSRLSGPDAPRLREEAMAAYAGIAASAKARPQMRLDAERGRAELAREAEDPAAALAALEHAVHEIPGNATRGLAGRERLLVVARTSGLAAEAAAAAVRAGEPERAVELLERSRGLLFNEALGIRKGWAELREAVPEAAAELERIEETLSEADAYSHIAEFTIEVSASRSGKVKRSSTGTWNPRPEWAAETRRLAAERERVVERIRALPGFADFLEPVGLPELRRETAGAPVVVVNAHRDGGDALLVPAEPGRPVDGIPLPGLHEAAVREQIGRLRAAVTDATDSTLAFDRRNAAQHELHGVLEWLWDRVAGPVLDRIASLGPQGTDSGRLWWCPVGGVAQLPLHAAGYHREARGGRTVLDRVVSSYTPTISALAHALRRPWGPVAPTALVVAVADPMRAPALPQADTEAERIVGLIPGSTVLLGDEADGRAVEQGLRAHPVAHFACHGEADASIHAPLMTGLHLGKGEKLNPQQVHSYRLDHAELAFLSACSTAEPHPDLPDEPLHLASAFQLAGFRGVIGTLWRTTDSPRVAQAVYSALTAGGAVPIDPSRAAVALRETLRRIRDEFPAVPTRWAAHLHVGV